MLKNMKVLLAIVLFVAPYVAGHTETSDLEDNAYLKLEKLLFFKKRPNKNSLRVGSQDALYGYDGGSGTSNWDGVCASGNKQSPINFVPEETVAVYRRVLRFNGAQQIPHSTNITNSGHSIKIKLRTQKPITVTGGVFGNKVYEFQQLHFHWGKNVNEGSEHTTNSKRYPLEAHLVFYKADAKDPTTAPDGMAVLGVQYDFFRKDNLVLEPIIKSIRQIRNPGQYVVKPNGLSLREYLPADLDSYLSYTGSLTTPPCTEGVTWIVFSTRQTVSERQVSEFRTMKDDLGLNVEYNYRETLPLNGRQVHLVKSSERVVT
uniref:carbonic anhydrase n=2 Tax=Lygus hesperus TaxID=30085 RepID=A0A0A9WRF7_LYGHE